jgi:hypothetical protein
VDRPSEDFVRAFPEDPYLAVPYPELPYPEDPYPEDPFLVASQEAPFEDQVVCPKESQAVDLGTEVVGLVEGPVEKTYLETVVSG